MFFVCLSVSYLSEGCFGYSIIRWIHTNSSKKKKSLKSDKPRAHGQKATHLRIYTYSTEEKKNTNSFDHHYKPFSFIYSVFVVFVFQPPVFSLCFDFVAFSICYFSYGPRFSLFAGFLFFSLFFVCMWLWYFTAIWICHIGSEMNKY